MTWFANSRCVRRAYKTHELNVCCASRTSLRIAVAIITALEVSRPLSTPLGILFTFRDDNPFANPNLHEKIRFVMQCWERIEIAHDVETHSTWAYADRRLAFGP